jgi:hypothetical protein
MPDEDVTLSTLTDEQLRAKIRKTKQRLAIARKTVAIAHKIVTADRAIASTQEADLKLLQLEQNRRSDEASAKVRDWIEEQSNFEKQLVEITSVILRHFPEDLTQTASIPEAVRRIVERFSPTNDSPRAMPSTDQKSTDQPKQ